MLDTCCLLQEGWKRQWGNEPWHYVASLEEVSSVEFCYTFFLNVVERRSCMFLLLWEKKAVTFIKKEKPNAGVILSLLFWGLFWRKLCNAWPSWMLSTVRSRPVLFAWPRRLTSDWLKDLLTEQMQNIQAHFFTLLFGLFILLIFCISESTCPLTTVLNIGRVIMPLSVRGVHPSVASCSIFSERKHYISVDLVFTCREDGACTQSSICPSVYC